MSDQETTVGVAVPVDDTPKLDIQPTRILPNPTATRGHVEVHVTTGDGRLVRRGGRDAIDCAECRAPKPARGGWSHGCPANKETYIGG